MRIRHIKIERWRHFQGVECDLPDNAPIICIVGGNGTGKSQILELIAACAQRIGLTPGLELLRGDPFNEEASFKVVFLIARDTIPTIDGDGGYPAHLNSQRESWDRTLTIESSPAVSVRITAGNVSPDHSEDFAQVIIRLIQKSSSVHYLFLDADRAYPKVQMSIQHINEALSRDWELTKKESSFRVTRNLYEEWFRFLIGRENQENNKYVQAIRVARNASTPDPRFVDQFESYKNALRRVLPHLLFVGVDPQRREIKFDSTGVELSFDQLSGGEREIAFLVGQIERFALKKGLLLVDEPELHLNYDLLRAWIGFLKSSVEEGQIWLATHSLEVVEVTGQDATLILQRDDETRRVIAATPLSAQPVVATLSRAIGSPAFSISTLSFVLIEGEEEIGERERFRLLCENPNHVRFLEAGSCKEVIRRIAELKKLAFVSGQTIRIGGVVDQDWRPRQEQSELSAAGLFVLGVHEVENFFLHPPTLRDLIDLMGGNPSAAEGILTAAADRRAGSWIFNAARTDRKFRDCSEPSTAVRQLVHGLSWLNFTDLSDRCDEIARSHGNLDEPEISLFRKHLETRAKIYSRKRESGELWKVCEGKEVFRAILPQLGLKDEDTGERALTSVWARKPDLLPKELVKLRAYVRGL